MNYESPVLMLLFNLIKKHVSLKARLSDFTEFRYEWNPLLVKNQSVAQNTGGITVLKILNCGLPLRRAVHDNSCRPLTPI